MPWQKPNNSIQSIPCSLTTLFDSTTEYSVDMPTSTPSDSATPRFSNGVSGMNNSTNGQSTTIELGYVNGAASRYSTPPTPFDIAMPTANGGYSHTTASKAKISAANKGKTPWNKGRQRSPEERARIAAGVRAKNRERFLKKLADMGVTEEEYEAQKKEERRKKDAERRARKTANGGYSPTQETRQKISKILKEKYASGAIKRKTVDPSKVRRGFTHSEETRKKISETLKKRWATDEEYREKMKQKTYNTNTSAETRQKISETLKQKWQDPEFREQMLEKMATQRNHGNQSLGESHREKISQAMKARWQDADYRQKVIDSMARKRKVNPPRQKAKAIKPALKATNSKAVRKPGVATLPTTGEIDDMSNSVETAPEQIDLGGIRPVAPLATPRKAVKKRKVKKNSSVKKSVSKVKKKKASKKKKKAAGPSMEKNDIMGMLDDDDDDLDLMLNDSEKPSKKGTGEKNNGSVDLLREERRDLYDLLYGEDDQVKSNNKLASVFNLGDENLDTFDPYGLEDF